MAAVLVALLAVVGCDQQARAETPAAAIRIVEHKGLYFPDGVSVIHDDKRAVTCWVLSEFRAGGISCLPDWMITKPLSSEPRPCVGHRVCAGLPELQP